MIRISLKIALTVAAVSKKEKYMVVVLKSTSSKLKVDGKVVKEFVSSEVYFVGSTVSLDGGKRYTVLEIVEGRCETTLNCIQQI
jgi:hypothetical protein